MDLVAADVLGVFVLWVDAAADAVDLNIELVLAVLRAKEAPRVTELPARLQGAGVVVRQPTARDLTDNNETFVFVRKN